ncbi:MAG: hypothetical protein KAT49_01710 [Methanomicrobia archaeon]|nr:hypothetical protein [Methanomicrobia archaeon]
MKEKKKDLVTCPKCKFTFSKSYSRVVSCKGCPQSVTHCAFIKCPKCGHEFYGRNVRSTVSLKN